MTRPGREPTTYRLRGGLWNSELSPACEQIMSTHDQSYPMADETSLLCLSGIIKLYEVSWLVEEL